MKAKELIEAELVRLEAKLKAFDRLNDTPYLSYAVKALNKSNAALSKYIQTKDESAYKWAELWDKAKKHFTKQAEKQNITDYADKRVALEIEISDLKNNLYFCNRR